MADVHDKATRSYNMSRVKGKDTTPEMIVRRFLHAEGFRYRVHVKDLPGKPDIVLPKYKTVIFVHGCFWHGHEGCDKARLPATRTDWWRQKINTNKANDKKSLKSLHELGWQIIEVWQCELHKTTLENTLENLCSSLSNAYRD